MATPKAKLRPVHESSQGQRPLSRKSNVPLPTGMKSPDQHVSLEDSEPPASGQLDNEPKSAARLMGPPPLPLSKQHQQRPHPAALTPDSQHDNRDTANGQHDFEYGHVIENEHAYMDNPHDQVDDVHLDEGNAQSAPFDWHEIQQRYHNALENQTMIENDAWSEFCKLLDVCQFYFGRALQMLTLTSSSGSGPA